MKILQILPELNSGGVELCTLALAEHLAQNGHESLVVSNGGHLVPNLEAKGSRHITMPVHRKRLSSLLQVRPLRRLFEHERPDIVHIHSRMPGWIAWLAWRRMKTNVRPRFASTVHGFHSVNAYSAIMTRGERIIAVSESTRQYIEKNYPRTDTNRIRVIPHGVPPGDYSRNLRPSEQWLREWHAQYPALTDKIILLLPGRITRLKGHETFFHLLSALRREGLPAHGLIVGGIHPKKRAYFDELQHKVKAAGLDRAVTFVGHRSDLREIMTVSDIVYSLSTQPESFGLTTLEALALGRPVIGWAHGGVGELLDKLFPPGLVPLNDVAALVRATHTILQGKTTPSLVGPPWTRVAMGDATLEVWAELLGVSRPTCLQNIANCQSLMAASPLHDTGNSSAPHTSPNRIHTP